MTTNEGLVALIADDEPDLREILGIVLEAEGFTVLEANNGQEALDLIKNQTPDIMILDYMMPVMTGPELCKEVKKDIFLRHVPIIMLTGKKEVQDKVEGINAGADDYVIKPFEPEELLARVQMVLRRTTQGLEANPLTRLPGNTSIQSELDARIRAGQGIAACYVDLNRFKAFNDHYGFKRGDEVIAKTAQVLMEASRAKGGDNDFLGHIGGDDFILLTNPETAEDLCQEVIDRFDTMALQLYDEEDRQRGYIIHKDRAGNKIQAGFLSIAIALVSSEDRTLDHPAQIAEIGAQLKGLAKQSENSTYVRDRRRS